MNNPKSRDSLKEYIRKGGFYKPVVEEGADVIVIVDYEGFILYSNPSIVDSTGYSPINLSGKNFFDYIHPDTKKEMKRMFKVAKKQQYTENVEFLFKTNDQDFKYFEFNSINLKYKDGYEALILDCRDISQRKKDAEELVRAQKAKELFLANMSHEIRTPISGISGMITLLEQFNLSQEQKEYLQAIKNSADYLKVIINDILDFTAIESGKLKFEEIGFKPGEEIKKTIDSFTPKAKEKGLNLRYKTDKEVNQVVIGDPVRLNQIMVNLINNAIKFTEKGEIKVSAEVFKKAESKHFIKYTVKDTGIGIAPEKLNNIFESFSQADASINRRYGGTGLGLAICQQLVELQNGQISVNSKEGQGSTFSFVIPYVVGSEQDLDSLEQKRKDLTETVKFKGFKILVVEDNDINKLYVTRLLEKWDCVIETAENGKIAIEKIKENDFDVILMDLQMPVMDGFEATFVIRNELPENKTNIPIIALTANAIKGDNEKCLAAGMNNYLSKPFSPGQLIERITPYFKGEVQYETDKSDKGDAEQKPKDKTLIDLGYLKKISNNDKGFIKEMIQTFIEKTPSQLSEIEKACENQDWMTVGSIAHKLKPSITLMGIETLKEIIYEIEIDGKNNQHLTELPPRITKFTNICKKAIAELELLLSQEF